MLPLKPLRCKSAACDEKPAFRKSRLNCNFCVIAAPGPWDGFTSYVIFGNGRPRWCDYGAAAVDGSNVWVASRYAAQSLRLSYVPHFIRRSVRRHRGALGNWSTHVSKVAP